MARIVEDSNISVSHRFEHFYGLRDQLVRLEGFGEFELGVSPQYGRDGTEKFDDELLVLGHGELVHQLLHLVSEAIFGAEEKKRIL